MNHATWRLLHPLSATRLAVGDFVHDTRDEVAISFPDAGLWVWSEQSSWRQMNPNPATALTIGGHMLVAAFAGQGTWFTNGGTWTRIDTREARTIIVADIEPEQFGSRDEYVLAIPGAGLWSYHRLRGLSQLHPFDVVHLAAGDLDGQGPDDLVVDFGPAWGL